MRKTDRLTPATKVYALLFHTPEYAVPSDISWVPGPTQQSGS